MLKELFESSFYITFPHKAGAVINLREDVYTSSFTLRDPNACRDCMNVCHEVDAERVQLTVNTTTAINVLSIDNLLESVKEPVGKNCDYMLESDAKVALIEMTCSTTDYVDSKRCTAREQLYNTLCLMRANPVVRTHLNEKQCRYVVFSWKDTTPKGVDDMAADNMMGMMTMADEVYSPLNTSEFDYGFVLKELRYPDALTWSEL